MKNIAVINENETAMGIGATEAEARAHAIECGCDTTEGMQVVRLTPASVAVIESGDPDAVEVEQ